MSVVQTFAERIIDRWDEWEADAGQQAQMYQDPDAGRECMAALVKQELTALVEQAALVCEGRAKHLKNQIPVYNEAMKCAGQIRHNLTV